MSLWTQRDFIAALGVAPTRPFAASGVSVDAATLRPGELYVALGPRGHAQIASALALGAAGVVAQRGAAWLPDEAPLLLVPDTLNALWSLGAHGRDRFAGRLVAVTGNVGKTTVRDMLHAMLAVQGETHDEAPGDDPLHDAALTLARLPPSAEWCVLEIAQHLPGEIGPRSRLARPHVAVVTACAEDEATVDELASILRGLEPGGTALLPASPRRLRRDLPAGANLLTFGGPGGADARLTAAIGGIHGSDVGAVIAGEDVRFRLAAPGRAMAMDAVAALTALHALGADMTRGAEQLAHFRRGGGLAPRRPLLGGAAMLLDETRNGSPPSMRAALGMLRLAPRHRRLAVLGDMEGRNGRSAAEHAGLAPDVDESADLLFACGPQMRHLFDAVRQSHRGAYAEDSDALAAIVASSVAPGDAVLVKGGLGSRMERVVEALERRSA